MITKYAVEKAYSQVLSNFDEWLAFDFETSDQNRYTCKLDRVCVISFDVKTKKIKACHQDVFRDGQPPSTKLKELMSSLSPKVAHNAGFDLFLMEHRLGVPVVGPIHDTRLMAKHWRNDLPAYDLKSLAWWLQGDIYEPLIALRAWIHEHNVKGEDPDEIGFDMTACPDKLVQAYCVHDCEVTARLVMALLPSVQTSYAYQLDTKVLRLVMEMERRGMPVDLDYFHRFKRLGRRRIHRNLRQAKDEMKLEGQRKPTGHALRERLEARGETRRTHTGLTRADDVVLRSHTEDAVVRAVQRVRYDQKLVNTYVSNILAVAEQPGQWGILHPNFVQSDAITLRFRSRGLYGDNGVITKGQVQNIPRGPTIRTGFAVPPKAGWFGKLDLASIEARIFSAFMEILMGEKTFAEMFRKDRHFSPYVLILQRCGGVREATKKHELYTPYKHGTLGRLYGSSPQRFSLQLREAFNLDYDEDQCQAIYRKIDHEFPFIRRFQRLVTSLVESQGCISDLYGMSYHVPREEAYKAVAYLCQGCAGWVLKDWWVRVEELIASRHWPDHFFCTVHDELDGWISNRGGKRNALTRIKAYCAEAEKIEHFGLPIIAETKGLCANWGEAD